MDLPNTEYPKLVINLKKLRHNIDTVLRDCTEAGIEVAGVVKGFNGLVPAVREFVEAGCQQIGTSRLGQIIAAKEQGLTAEFLLVRIPMLSEVAPLVRYADMSLESEVSVVEAIEQEAARQGKTHGVILMADLGDLREGFWDKEEMVDVAAHIENDLPHVELIGVGTNLGCYGSIKPDVAKMEELISIAERIEGRIGRTLRYISGGATSSYPLVLDGVMPARINHLRIGEGITLAYDLKEIWGLDMSRLHQDVFTLQAEVIEVKDKPTHPVGEIFIDCFGSKPTYEDRGIRRRALLGMGKLDYALRDKIFPRLAGAELIGDSSDHAILDVEDCAQAVAVGDIIDFDLTYPAVMYLTGSTYTNITFVE